MRRSLGVSDSGPVSDSLRGRPPAAYSSASRSRPRPPPRIAAPARGLAPTGHEPPSGAATSHRRAPRDERLRVLEAGGRGLRRPHRLLAAPGRRRRAAPPTIAEHAAIAPGAPQRRASSISCPRARSPPVADRGRRTRGPGATARGPRPGCPCRAPHTLRARRSLHVSAQVGRRRGRLLPPALGQQQLDVGASNQRVAVRTRVGAPPHGQRLPCTVEVAALDRVRPRSPAP